MRRGVYCSSGPFSWMIEDGYELFATMLRVLVYAIRFKRSGGVCSCGCEIAECDYCAHECDAEAPGYDLPLGPPKSYGDLV